MNIIQMMPMIWMILVILFIGVELATMGLATIWFAGGAVAGLAASILGANIMVQGILFLAVSIILLIFTRPFAERYINRGHIRTNVEAIPGKRAVVQEEISNLHGTGRVLLEGNEWMARTEQDSETIGCGTLVQVLYVSGAKLIVKEEKKIETDEMKKQEGIKE